jgi:signal transduction histidine kinase
MTTMGKLGGSIAARLVVAYGLLSLLSILVVGAVLYVGTVGVLDQHIDTQITFKLEHLVGHFRDQPLAALTAEVRRQLSDGVDSDREIFLLVDANRVAVAGNLSSFQGRAIVAERLVDINVIRQGNPTPARVIAHRFADGALLVVGRDLSEHESIRILVWHALGTGIGLSLLLTIAGAYLFRHQVEGRIGEIRKAARAIGAGNMSQRIAVAGTDEFAMLSGDINRMLDRIEQLMDGVRHVSNAIAHDLRTPIGRIRSKLDDALNHEMTVSGLTQAAVGAIDDIDDLIRLFERLLQIAEAESGVRVNLFEPVDLNRIAQDMVEMYEATAEDGQVNLIVDPMPFSVFVRGDRHLLASAIASLIENAIKYAGPGASVRVGLVYFAESVAISVRDNGPGIPASEREKVVRRFYRLDKSRHLAGNGLGLSIVYATALLHGGSLSLNDGQPGLVASITLPDAIVQLMTATS